MKKFICAECEDDNFCRDCDKHVEFIEKKEPTMSEKINKVASSMAEEIVLDIADEEGKDAFEFNGQGLYRLTDYFQRHFNLWNSYIKHKLIQELV